MEGKNLNERENFSAKIVRKIREFRRGVERVSENKIKIPFLFWFEISHENYDEACCGMLKK